MSKKPTKPTRRTPAKAKDSADAPEATPAKPVPKSAPKATKTRSGLLGLGLDNEDGHKRITTGEQFVLLGGSEETHERMTETAVKTFEELKRRHKRLETVAPKELEEIMEAATPR